MFLAGLWPLLLPAAAFSGWMVGRRHPNEVEHASPSLSREYYVGLNYLLNEQPDKAVDIFIKLLEVDGDTVETHLALGSLFRRRGEVDRAIRIHQNIIARPQLSNAQRAEALLALGRDYMSAGVLDRAERIFHEFINVKTEHSGASLYYLLDIYQQEKAWESAIACAQKIEAATGDDMQSIISHHYCEIATREYEANHFDKAKGALKKAFAANRNSVRASLLQAQLELGQHRYKAAIKLYKRIKTQDPEFISEIIEPLGVCYEHLGEEYEYIDFLKQTQQQYPRISIVLVLAKRLFTQYGLETAMDYVTTELRKHPSLRGLKQLIDWHLLHAEGKVHEQLQVLNDITQKLLKDKPIYRCEKCGFSGKQIHWQCPGCRSWDSVKPIHGLEGD